MDLIDPLCITAVGALAGAMARRFAPRATPRHLSQAVALGAAGAWGGVLLATWLVASGAGSNLAGATAWACALLGAVIALDAHHLLLRRQVCWPGRGPADAHQGSVQGQSQTVQRGLAFSPSAQHLQKSWHATHTGVRQIHRSGAAFGSPHGAPQFGAKPNNGKRAVVQYGDAPAALRVELHGSDGLTGIAQSTRPPKASNRALSFAQERKLARKRRQQRTRSGSRARAQGGHPGPARPT